MSYYSVAVTFTATTLLLSALLVGVLRQTGGAPYPLVLLLGVGIGVVATAITGWVEQIWDERGK